MPIDPVSGILIKRDTNELLNENIVALRDRFGEDLDVSPTGVTRKLLEAAFTLPYAEIDNDLDDIYRQAFFESAQGINLDKIVEPLGFVRLVATRAQGSVQMMFKSVQVAADPLFATGDLTFLNSGGVRATTISPTNKPAKSFESTETGTQSQSIDSLTTRIAQKFTLTETTTVPNIVTFTVAHGAEIPEFTLGIYPDAAGEPGADPVSPRLFVEGILPPDGTEAQVAFTEPYRLDAGTYWVVLERVEGDGTFDGGTGGTADQVLVYDPSGPTWSPDSNVENLNLAIHEAGVAQVRAVQLGAIGNIEAEAISKVSPINNGVATFYSQNVAYSTNLDNLSGGTNDETNRDLRNRVRFAFASREIASVDGIATGLLSVPGVSGVSILENATTIGTALDNLFNASDATGTSDPTLDATNTQVAQKFQVTDAPRWMQHFTARLAADSNLIATVRIETDNAGSPSGILAYTGGELTGFDFDGTNETSGTFEEGEFLAAGTDYWLVFVWESGSGTFEADAGGSAGDVQYNDGSWNNAGTATRINTRVISGIPPHSFRAYVSGGDKDAIAQKIWDVKAAGIYSDGIIAGNALDRGGFTQVTRFDRPVLVPVVLDVTITKTPEFSGTADSMKDIIVNYIGGFDTQPQEQAGLSVQQKLVRNEVLSRLLDDDLVTGTSDVTLLRVGRKATFPTPASLTSNEEINLLAQVGEEFIVEDVDTDIRVTLVDEVL